LEQGALYTSSPYLLGRGYGLFFYANHVKFDYLKRLPFCSVTLHTQSTVRIRTSGLRRPFGNGYEFTHASVITYIFTCRAYGIPLALIIWVITLIQIQEVNHMKKLMTMFGVMLFAFVGLGVMGSSAADQPGEAQYGQPASERMQPVEAPAEQPAAGQQPYEMQEPALQGDASMPAEGFQAIQGTITLVGDNQLNIMDTDAGVEHQIRIDDAQEDALTTGYDITAQVDNGRLVNYTLGGVPPNVKEIVYTARNLPEENILEQQKVF
jgi:hypothetical protein